MKVQIRRTMPLIGMLIVIALLPSIIGALLGSEGTGTFAIDFLLFGPIIPVIAVLAILLLPGKFPWEDRLPAEETASPEPMPEERPAEEPSEPETEESTAVETEEETEEETDKETSEEIKSVCPTCGSAVTLEDEYCPHCGAEFEDEADTGSPDSEEN
jgi:hypothetical protein